MRLALIANPGSGKGLEPADLCRRLEGLGADVVLCEEGWRGDDDTRARAAAADRLVVAGGDGTLGPCAELASELGVPLAVVAIGTANDFARDQRLPRELDDALRLAVEGASTRRLELARMDGRPFVNAASGGLSPLAAERAKPFKRFLGPAAYAVGAVSAGLTGRPFACRATVNGHVVVDDRAWQVIVAATGAFGAGADIEEADPQDGHLDLVAVRARSRLLLPATALAMRAGTLASRAGVVHSRGREIELEVEAQTPFNVDGEIVRSETGTVRFTVQGSAYALVAP